MTKELLLTIAHPVTKYYHSSQSFTCISNPSITIDIGKVNDDYCDCPDGSDEPGTSACSHLSDLSPQTPGDISSETANKSIALPGFYCKNKGHLPGYISFQRLNDGVCDHDLCCDGSDEWAQVGGLKCENKCKEIGKEWRKQDEARRKALGAATKKRQELVVESARLRKEVEDQIANLGTQIEGEILKVQALEESLATAEKQERGKVVKGPGKASRTNVLAGLAKDRVEELRETLLEVKTQRDEHAKNVNELEAILSTFKEEYNPNFNDEGVKRAVRKWEEYAARTIGQAPADNDAFNRDLDEISKPDSETGVINWAEWEAPEEESDVDVRKSLLLNLTLYVTPINTSPPSQSINSKPTSPPRSAIGSIPNSVIFASFSSKMAFSPPLPLRLAENPSNLPTHATP